MSTARLTDDELALVVGRVRATLARLGDAADDPIVVDNVIDDEIALAIDYRRGPPGRENGPGQGPSGPSPPRRQERASACYSGLERVMLTVLLSGRIVGSDPIQKTGASGKPFTVAKVTFAQDGD